MGHLAYFEIRDMRKKDSLEGKGVVILYGNKSEEKNLFGNETNKKIFFSRNIRWVVELQ